MHVLVVMLNMVLGSNVHDGLYPGGAWPAPQMLESDVCM